MKTRQTVTHVPVEQLRAHPANVRDDLGPLTEMAASIREHGILQPLTATEDPEHHGKLLLLAGHRRLGAACLAGLTTLPVIIRHGLTDESEHLVVMLVENTQRRELSPMEKAEAFGALRNRGLSVAEISRRTGVGATTVSTLLNLLLLQDEDQEKVREGELTAGEAIAQVREQRQKKRIENGSPVRGRPKAAPWFSTQHRLAAAVRANCSHPEAFQVGGVGCGPCWEAAVITESNNGGAVA